MDVSEDRAENAKERLLKLIEEQGEGLSSPGLKQILQLLALGTEHSAFRHP